MKAKKKKKRWVRLQGSRTKPDYEYDYVKCKQSKTEI